MKYKTRPGIIKTKICGVHLLIPDRQTSEVCPSILRLSMMTAGLWEGISKDYPMEKIYLPYRIILKKTDEEIEKIVNEKINELYEKGFLILCEDNTP